MFAGLYRITWVRLYSTLHTNSGLHSLGTVLPAGDFLAGRIAVSENLTQSSGARPVTLSVRLHLRQGGTRYPRWELKEDSGERVQMAPSRLLVYASGSSRGTSNYRGLSENSPILVLVVGAGYWLRYLVAHFRHPPCCWLRPSFA